MRFMGVFFFLGAMFLAWFSVMNAQIPFDEIVREWYPTIKQGPKREFLLSAEQYKNIDDLIIQASHQKKSLKAYLNVFMITLLLSSISLFVISTLQRRKYNNVLKEYAKNSVGDF